MKMYTDFPNFAEAASVLNSSPIGWKEFKKPIVPSWKGSQNLLIATWPGSQKQMQIEF